MVDECIDHRLVFPVLHFDQHAINKCPASPDAYETIPTGYAACLQTLPERRVCGVNGQGRRAQRALTRGAAKGSSQNPAAQHRARVPNAVHNVLDTVRRELNIGHTRS